MTRAAEYQVRLTRGCPVNTPDCKYAGEPHFVPPSLGQVGFYMCDVPEDIRNHTRCRAPFDHEHEDHFDWIPVRRPGQ